MSRSVRWFRSRFLQTLVVIFRRKSTQVKIHTKMAIFWLVFSARNPVKSVKLALIEGKILNLMFFDINIPVVPIEIWLRVTHNQRQKTLKVASVLLFRHILKMWPGILRDALLSQRLAQQGTGGSVVEFSITRREAWVRFPPVRQFSLIWIRKNVNDTYQKSLSSIGPDKKALFLYYS